MSHKVVSWRATAKKCIICPMRLGAGHSPFKYRFAKGGLMVAKAVQTIALTCVDCAGSSSLNYRVGAGRKRDKISRVVWQVACWKFRS